MQKKLKKAAPTKQPTKKISQQQATQKIANSLNAVKKIADLMTSDCLVPLSRFGFDILATDFQDKDYEKMRNSLKHVQCYNTIAERGVKVATDFNEFGPLQEEQHQRLIKTVARQRSHFNALSVKGLQEQSQLLNSN